jgi:hypothetical protein
MDLDAVVPVTNGQWVASAWGTSTRFNPRYAFAQAWNKSETELGVRDFRETNGRITAHLRITVPTDMWGTAGTSGEYEISLTCAGDRFEGEYRGICGGQSLTGRIDGVWMAPYRTPVPGFVPPTPCEHPRLVFRKSDLSMLRERAVTPEGRAMMARLKELLASRVTADTAGYHAAGHGLVYLIEGDAAAAGKARDLVEKMLFGAGIDARSAWKKSGENERIIRAPLAVGVALAYDLCYDAWPADFRDKVTDQLEFKARDMVEGVSRDQYSDNYPSNHGGICQGAGGLAALAILGEPGEFFDEPVAPAQQVAAPIAPPAGYTPGRGAPVARLEPGKMPTQWLFAGPLKPESTQKDFLGGLGSWADARPEEGTVVASDGTSVVFRALDPKVGVVNNKYTGGRDALDLLTPIGRAYRSTILYYSVLDVGEDGLFQFVCEHGGTRAFLSGQEVRNGQFARLSAGRHPFLLQVGVGITVPWGQITTAPHFVGVPDDYFERATRQYERDHAAWREAKAEWEANGRDRPTVRRQLGMAAWRLRMHKFYSTGDRGWYNEGESYSRYAKTNGELPFEVAWLNVKGEYGGGAASGSAWYVPLWAVRLVNWGGKPVFGHYGPGDDTFGNDIWRSGDFAMGFAIAPKELLPACRWVFDRFWGMEGDKSFGIFEPHHALYALAHYPFDVPARNPDGILPKVLHDTEKGFVNFRNRWQDADDYVACIYGKSEPTGGGWSFADGASFRFLGRRTMWVKKGGGNSDGGQEVENVVTMPGVNGWLGAQVTDIQAAPDGSGAVSLDTSDIYLAKPDGKGGQANAVIKDAPPGARIVADRLLDWGVRGLRCFAVDYSGKSGSEAMLVLLDRIIIKDGGKLPAGEPTWQLHTGSDTAVDGATFTIKGNGGYDLVGRFVHPSNAPLKLEGNRLTCPGREFLVVMTVQKGPAPALTVEGNGMPSAVKLGEQTIRFDGQRIRLGP